MDIIFTYDVYTFFNLILKDGLAEVLMLFLKSMQLSNI